MVLICSKHKLMFVMVPATGCTALGEVLKKEFNGKIFPKKSLFEDGKKVRQKHTSIQQLLKYGLMTKEELDQYLTFATIRNPFDRFTSLYQRRVGSWSQAELDKDKEALNRLEKKMKETNIDDLEEDRVEFLKNSIENRVKRMNKAQELGFDAWLEDFASKYLEEYNGKKMSLLYPMINGVDQLIRYEFYENDFNMLLKNGKIIALDDWVNIPQNNPTQGKKKYQDYYSEKSRAFVEENFSKELAAFNYKFE